MVFFVPLSLGDKRLYLSRNGGPTIPNFLPEFSDVASRQFTGSVSLSNNLVVDLKRVVSLAFVAGVCVAKGGADKVAVARRKFRLRVIALCCLPDCVDGGLIVAEDKDGRATSHRL